MNCNGADAAIISILAYDISMATLFDFFRLTFDDNVSAKVLVIKNNDAGQFSTACGATRIQNEPDAIKSPVRGYVMTEKQIHQVTWTILTRFAETTVISFNLMGNNGS